jgi:hypothetical protein
MSRPSPRSGETFERPFTAEERALLYELAETRRFPSTAFEISRVAASGGFLALTPLGEDLAPSTERERFTGEEYEHNRIPKDGAFVQAKFEDLRHSHASAVTPPRRPRRR